MYESDFRLTERPFLAAPRPDRYFPATVTDEARTVLTRCVERAEGVGLLIGPSGTGKTLLCQMLAEHFADTLQVAVPLTGRMATPRAMLQSILFELGRPYRGLDEGELRLSLIDHLGSDQRSPNGMLLIVDEAQTLSLRLLEELRLISNLVRYGQPRVRLVLSGGPVLEERFAHPKLELFSQRVVARVYLESLSSEETRGYVIAQIEACGGEARSIFTDDALTAIHHATDGVPRLINQVCDHALVLAFAGGRDRISGAGIEEAWADMQQLPTSLNEPSQGASDQSPGDVVEFGGLEDEAMPEPSVQQSYAPDESESIAASSYSEQTRDTDAPRDELQPAASDQATVELVFPKADESADEVIDAEEVVIDRYAEFDRQAWCGPTVVNRLEDGELARLLEPYAQNNSSDRFRLVDASTIDEPAESAADAACVADDPAASDAAIAGQSVEGAQHDRGRQVHSAPPHESLETVQARTAQGKGFANVDTPSVDSLAYEPMGIDDDLIVIQDDPVEWEPLVDFQQAVARRQEYRGLFARLRSG